MLEQCVFPIDTTGSTSHLLLGGDQTTTTPGSGHRECTVARVDEIGNNQNQSGICKQNTILSKEKETDLQANHCFSSEY